MSDNQVAQTNGAAASPLLKAEGLWHARGGRMVLDIRMIEFFPGETLCLMGRNGAGKSTLVSILNLLEKPSRGTVLYGGERVGPGSKAARRRMAGVFQQPHMFAGTVESNVAYGLRMRRVPAAEIERRVGAVLDDLGIEHIRNHDARSLSGGEAQRVALARAIVLKPEVLFLDEPAGNLDRLARQDLHRDLRRIAVQENTTVIYVTHSPEEARAVAGRIAILDGGRIRQIGRAREVFGSPADDLVARLLDRESADSKRLGHIGRKAV
ncbi:MAG: ABC transporter ATP-binding protein [Thermoleophilia bacterium]|nr:ABC transporter ATP-binding protein [Thermoleophilia bacterium]